MLFIGKEVQNYKINETKGRLVYMSEKKVTRKMYLDWIKEIQAIAQNGLAYQKNPFDRERFQRIRDIACEMLSHDTGIPLERVKDIFASEIGYKTPKLDTRTAVFKDGKLLLVKERFESWSLPGGWVDEGQTVASNAIKEVMEEAGMEVELEGVIAILDRNKGVDQTYVQDITRVFMLGKYKSGKFKENYETYDAQFFTLEEIRGLKLSKYKLNIKQIEMCFAAKDDKNWKVIYE